MTTTRIRVLCAILLIAVSVGCRNEDKVVIHVFRDPAAPIAPQLARAIEHFHSLKIHATDGKLILIETEPADYRTKLQDVGRGLNPELVFLNSRGEAEKNPALQQELARAIELGGEGRRCIAFIPSWVAGDELLATRTFFNFLTTSSDLW